MFLFFQVDLGKGKVRGQIDPDVFIFQLNGIKIPVIYIPWNENRVMLLQEIIQDIFVLGLQKKLIDYHTVGVVSATF